MKIHPLHPWNVSAAQAVAIQRNLRAWVVTEAACPAPSSIGRIQLRVAGESRSAAHIQASIKIYDSVDKNLIEHRQAIVSARFPTLPGLHSFRKVPAVIAALTQLQHTPDLFICDGRGITGDHSFGIASHVGLVTNIATIGVRAAKPKQIPPGLGSERGDWMAVAESETQAALLRLISGEDPALVSPAHKIDQHTALELLLDFVPEHLSPTEYREFLYPSPSQAQATTATPVNRQRLHR